MQTVTINNVAYPIVIEGSGIPCLVLGQGNLYQQTLSQSFKSKFTVYSSDLYWDTRYSNDVNSPLTMQQILSDIAEFAHCLALDNYMLFGHSAFGIVALEFAKKHPNNLLGIIMSGTPINSNPNVAIVNNAYFENHADQKRKELDLQESLQQKPFWRSIARNWHDLAYDDTTLWRTIFPSDVLKHFFTTILPTVNVLESLEKIACPIFLAAGLSDYNCCPFMWQNIPNLPHNMSIYEFKKSGHWPHFEEANLFDQKITKWLSSILLIKN